MTVVATFTQIHQQLRAQIAEVLHDVPQPSIDAPELFFVLTLAEELVHQDTHNV